MCQCKMKEEALNTLPELRDSMSARKCLGTSLPPRHKWLQIMEWEGEGDEERVAGVSEGRQKREMECEGQGSGRHAARPDCPSLKFACFLSRESSKRTCTCTLYTPNQARPLFSEHCCTGRDSVLTIMHART